MGIKFGEIDSSQILENEFRIGVLEKLLEYIMNNNPSIIKPSIEDVNEMKRSAIEVLRKKYPNSGIERK